MGMREHPHEVLCIAWLNCLLLAFLDLADGFLDEYFSKIWHDLPDDPLDNLFRGGSQRFPELLLGKGGWDNCCNRHS